MTQIGKDISGDTIPVLTNGEWADETIANGTAIIFAVPGAFTPTCSETHLPGFIEKYQEFKAKGVSEIYCLSVNDKFVMKAWADSYGDMQGIKMIADGSADFTKKYDLVLDLTPHGLGIRSKRYAMVLRDGVVEAIVFDDESFAEQVINLV